MTEEPPRGFGLPVVVIYRNPSDFPDRYVVRRQWAMANKVYVEHLPIAVVPTLDEARRAVPIQQDYRMQRDSADDPTIVETWI